MTPVIVTGAFGIFTTVLGLYKDELKQLFSRSSKFIAGKWKGEAGDVHIPGEPFYAKMESYKVSCQFKQRGKRVTGTMQSVSDREDDHILKGELRGEYLFLHSQNTDETMQDWLVLVLEVMNSGTDIRGFYLAPRLHEKGLALGSIKLKRYR